MKFTIMSGKKFRKVKCLAKILFNRSMFNRSMFLVSAFSLKGDWKALQRYLFLMSDKL